MIPCKMNLVNFHSEDIATFVHTNYCSLTMEKELMLASSLDELAAAEAFANCLLKSLRKAMRFTAD